MTYFQIILLITCLCFGVTCNIAVASPLIGQQTQEITGFNQKQQDIINDLKSANIIYLGENHDSIADHQAQLQIIEALAQNNPQIAIGLEMFQRPYQQYLDQYLAGTISETELREKTEYDERWGFDWEFYAPILRFAKNNGLRLIALNTSTEISRQVATDGLDSLSPEQRLLIPPISAIDTTNQGYRQLLGEIYQQHLHGQQGNSNDFERFFTVQVLWDETMAETIAKFHQNQPHYQIIVLAGKGHIIYDYGIPSRVARRISNPNLIQYSLLLGDSQDFANPENIEAADYNW